MKSAFELAMERLGGLKQLTDEQKKKLAEIERIYEAKKAEVRLGGEERLKKVAGEPEKESEVRRQIAEELARLEERKNAEKAKVRGEA